MALFPKDGSSNTQLPLKLATIGDTMVVRKKSKSLERTVGGLEVGVSAINEKVSDLGRRFTNLERANATRDADVARRLETNNASVAAKLKENNDDIARKLELSTTSMTTSLSAINITLAEKRGSERVLGMMRHAITALIASAISVAGAIFARHGG